MGVAEPDVDDLFQEILLAAYESLDRFDPAWPSPQPGDVAVGDLPRRKGRRQRRSPEARWVLGIAWRKVNRHLKRAYRRREVPDGLQPVSHHLAADPAPSSEERIAERERLELALEVLDTLPLERRILLVLYEAYEVPLVDIARELGINYNTASNRLRLAREDYRAAVERLRPEQREALRAFWVPFLLASDFLAQGDDADPPAPPAPTPPAPAPPGPSDLQRGLARIGRALVWAAAGGAGTAAVLLALDPAPPLWARRFGAMLPELPRSGACLATSPPHPTPEPRPAEPAPAPEALHHPYITAPRTIPAAGKPVDAFAEELRLLAAARDAIAAGDAAEALVQLAAHEARFPAGRLRSVRERLRRVARTLLVNPEQSAPGKEPSR
ncbi:uncharacterized protein SOCE26_057670 [Sorangium cellulosum]|uniref:RNA polymerase sigma factor 70 region 4 type 2 domain-containing protein n=1 Tax=Sorangium cellulosum TaxID=56 RepID=A0A2L0EYD7_SORCE|nr:sigma-70 family RNA polymerase sigma factor [Sorangium cellulosum]AUX44303.1 uncharacterized protein SOCE26_057670 [Sorangium cellulosum]